MFRTVIVDVDNKNVSGIKSYIKENFKMFHILETFNTSNSFQKYIKNNDVDLVIMEIRFLGVNFLRKIEELSNEYKNMKFIFYGILNDIDYLKKTIELGAVSYAIRPVKGIDLKMCLTSYIEYMKSLDTLEREEEMLDMAYVQNFKVFEDKFLTVLINEKIFDDDEIAESFEYFDIQVQAPYTVAVFRTDSFRKFIDNKNQKDKHIFTFRILKIIEKNLENSKSFINLFNEVVVILGGEQEEDKLFELMNEIKNQILEELNLKVSCGVGRTHSRPKRINTSYLEASTALKYRSIVGYNSVIFMEYVEPRNILSAIYPYDIEQNFVCASVIGDYDYAVILLDKMFKRLDTFKDKIEKILPQIVMSILISITRTSFEHGLEIEQINKFFKTNEVLALKTLDEAYNFLKKGTATFCNYISEVRKEDEQRIIGSALEFIQNNFDREITIRDIYKNANANPKYIKKLFLEETESSIENYIARVRIEEAKKLILETNLTDDLIAVKVGFPDVNVFRKTFKRLEGCLAGDFRYIKKDMKRR